MSLARRLLNNPGLIALTVEDEQQEIKTLQPKPRRIKFAFMQKGLDGNVIPFWHVDWKSPSEFGTTLSIDGLKQWGIL